MTPLSLVVLAAGLGSRYGGLKQLEPIGPSGEFLMDYAAFDAARAGIERAVFVIRREMERDFHARWGRRYAERLDVSYAFQELTAVPSFQPPAGRTRPWGTAHAVLAAAAKVNGPFVVSNADDFYGRESYRTLAEHLRRHCTTGPEEWALVGFELARTLSAEGSVSRGVCTAGADGFLTSVVEHLEISHTETGITGRAPDGTLRAFTGGELVSLNLWGFGPALFPELASRFERFLRAHGTEEKPELYLPTVVDELIGEGKARVRMLPTSARWLGVTYREDRPLVAAELARLQAAGEYPAELWGEA